MQLNTFSSMKTAHLISLVLISLFLSTQGMAQRDNRKTMAQSPDNRISIELKINGSLEFFIQSAGREVARVTSAGMQLAGQPDAFRNPVIKSVRNYSRKDQIIPAVPEKRSLIPDEYAETEILFKNNFGVKLRAYNDGVAWRYFSRRDDSLTVVAETFTLGLGEADSLYFGEETSFISHSERLYPYLSIQSLKEKQFCVIPLVIRKPNQQLIAFAESDLLDYPGLYLSSAGNGSAALNALLPKQAAKESISSDRRSYIVDQRNEYLARTSGTREFPWRVIGIADTDKDLLGNDIIYRLGSPCKLDTTQWIRPGKVAWDWWNNWNIWGVPFKAGINTETYKYYIDFASDYGLEYVILDEGWSDNDDIQKINPEIDMEALCSYAARKNVRLILWVTGRALEEKFGYAFSQFEKWGIAGIKVDFLIRDDQRMVEFYERVAAEAAKHKMLVDYHGSFKPSGFSRTYPNALTREGVQGSENNKWSKNITPTHDCTIPFTRMFAGPMDYTPGAMNNASVESFAPLWSEPMSMGTRCHELAKFIIFESPLQMLCDAPTRYRNEIECMEFLSKVPTTWDQTIPLDSRIGKYISIARKQGKSWYIGCMTNESARDIEIRLDFLPEGTYNLKSWSDGPNADRKGIDFTVTTEKVSRDTVLRIHLAPGGGYAAILN